MKNWSTDTKALVQNPKQYKLWQLEQLINYGLEGNKLSRNDLIANLKYMKIDPQKKKYIKFLIS